MLYRKLTKSNSLPVIWHVPELKKNGGLAIKFNLSSVPAIIKPMPKFLFCHNTVKITKIYSLCFTKISIHRLLLTVIVSAWSEVNPRQVNKPCFRVTIRKTNPYQAKGNLRLLSGCLRLRLKMTPKDALKGDMDIVC